MLQTQAIMTDQSQKGEKRKEDLLFNLLVIAVKNVLMGPEVSFAAASLNACYVFLFIECRHGKVANAT